MKLLFQSDDYGITDAVTEGVLKAITKGIVRNTGLFVNMKSSKEAAKKIKELDACVGIDINLVAGSPVTDPKLVPDLVDDEGRFITSRKRMKDNVLIKKENICCYFENDPYDYEQTYLEIENQVKKFNELMGKMPEYIHGHSLSTPNTIKATQAVADKYHIFYTYSLYGREDIQRIQSTWTPKVFPVEDQMKTDVESNLLRVLEENKNLEKAYYVCHCGYVDEDLFRETTYTIIRAKDLYAATSDKVKKFIEDNHIELITYRDIKE